VPDWRCYQPTTERGSPMKQIKRIGIDLAKSVFQVHGVPWLYITISS
jgi:hypothetical protein